MMLKIYLIINIIVNLILFYNTKKESLDEEFEKETDNTVKKLAYSFYSFFKILFFTLTAIGSLLLFNLY